MFLGTIKCRYEFSRDIELLFDGANKARAPAHEASGGRLQAKHEALVGVVVMDRGPSNMHRHLVAVQAKVEILKPKTSASGGHRGAVQKQGE